MSNKRLVTTNSIKDALDEMGISVRLNLITGDIDINGEPCDDPDDIKSLAGQIQSHLSESRHGDISDIEDSIMAIADENSYNPVQEMLDETTRDDKDRISALLDRVMGLKAKPDQADLVKRWLHQTLALAFNGDDNANDSGHDDDCCDFDNSRDLYGADGLLVLVGPQGCGKNASPLQACCR